MGLCRPLKKNFGEKVYTSSKAATYALVIDPFSVPRRFEEAGLTAEVSSEAHRTRRAPASIGEFTGNGDRFCPGYRCGSGIVT